LTKNSKNTDSIELAWRFFTSLKLTIVLFSIVIIALIDGTISVFPGGPDKAPGGFISALLNAAGFKGFTDIFHSLGFSLLLAMLGLNIVACTMDRFPSKWKKFRNKNPAGINAELLPLPANGDRTTISSAVISEAEKLLRHYFGRFSRTESDGKITLRHESGRWSLFSSVIIHAGVVFILIGAVLTSEMGFEGMLFAPENVEVGNAEMDLYSGQRFPAGHEFTLVCEKFVFEKFADGRPRDYKSDLKFMKNGREAARKTIRVNDPASFNGLSFYQASFQPDPAKTSFLLEFTSAKTGDTIQAKGKVDGNITTTVPGRALDATYAIEEYLPDMEGFGPALLLSRSDERGKNEFWVLKNFPDFDRKHRKADVSVTFAGEEDGYMTGLQVVYDPGANVVFFGAVVLIIGLFFAFFMSYREVVVEITGEDVKVAAFASRKKQPFYEKAEALIQDMKRSVGC